MARKHTGPILGPDIEAAEPLLILDPERAAQSYEKVSGWGPDYQAIPSGRYRAQAIQWSSVTAPTVEMVAKVLTTDSTFRLDSRTRIGIPDPERYPVVYEQIASGALIGSGVIIESLIDSDGVFGAALAVEPHSCRELYETFRAAYASAQEERHPPPKRSQPSQDQIGHRRMKYYREAVDHVTEVFLGRTPVLDELSRQHGEGLPPQSPEYEAYRNERRGLGAAAVAFGIPKLRDQLGFSDKQVMVVNADWLGPEGANVALQRYGERVQFKAGGYAENADWLYPPLHS